MNQPDILVESNGDFFSVTIPLIKNYKLENAWENYNWEVRNGEL